jgi:hypothetical protein
MKLANINFTRQKGDTDDHRMPDSSALDKVNNKLPFEKEEGVASMALNKVKVTCSTLLDLLLIII